MCVITMTAEFYFCSILRSLLASLFFDRHSCGGDEGSLSRFFLSFEPPEFGAIQAILARTYLI